MERHRIWCAVFTPANCTATAQCSIRHEHATTAQCLEHALNSRGYPCTAAKHHCVYVPLQCRHTLQIDAVVFYTTVADPFARGKSHTHMLHTHMHKHNRAALRAEYKMESLVIFDSCWRRFEERYGQVCSSSSSSNGSSRSRPWSWKQWHSSVQQAAEQLWPQQQPQQQRRVTPEASPGHAIPASALSANTAIL
jgi:hypothetical protein